MILVIWRPLSCQSLLSKHFMTVCKDIHKICQASLMSHGIMHSLSMNAMLVLFHACNDDGCAGPEQQQWIVAGLWLWRLIGCKGEGNQ